MNKIHSCFKNFSSSIKTRTDFLRWGVIISFLALPYYIFGGTLFIGGDDTRLFYIFPLEWLEKYATSSWMHFSTIGSENPNQFILPFVSVLSLLHLLISSKIVVTYLFFSLPLILGFLYFEKVAKEIFGNKDNYLEITMVSLFFVTSPILIAGQYTNYLYSVWLIALIPALQLYFIRYIKSGELKNVALAILWSLFLALSLYSIPWLLGYLLPLGAGGLVGLFFFFEKSHVYHFLKRSLVFTGAIILASSFWLLPFSMQFLDNSGSSLSSLVLSQETEDTFTPTVLATSQGSILYPLLNLFHRDIAFDFNWELKSAFLSLYDKTFYLNFVFIFLLFSGILMHKKHLRGIEEKIYLITSLSFLVSLFLFTVNIGILKDVFLLLGKIPGFVMFRNAFDKFALGYVLIYMSLLAFSLIIFSREYKKKKIIYYSLIILLFSSSLINFYPIKGLLIRSLWTTESVGTTINLPTEYLSFAQQVKSTSLDDGNAFSVPFGVSNYTIIKDAEKNSVYAGRSPLELLAGVNDFSGDLSFSSEAATLINKFILSKNYYKLNNFFDVYNVRYIFETNNVPGEVLKSYLFKNSVVEALDDDFKQFFYGPSIVNSDNSNYRLFELKNNDKRSVVTIPKRYYYFTGSTTEPLFNLVNVDNLIVENPKDNVKNKLNSAAIISLSEELEVSAGNYKIYSDNQLPRSISFKEDESYRLNPPSDVVYEYQNNSGWGEGDCAAIDSPGEVSFKYIDAIVELTSSGNHEACIYRSFNVDDESVYILSLDYKSTDEDEFKVHIGFDNGEYKILTNQKNSDSWQNVNLEIEAPAGSKMLTIHLYSGRSDQTSATSYKNIKLVSVPKNFYQNLLVSDNHTQLLQPEKVEVRKISNTKYELKISDAQESFFINFHESYHPGWKIYPSSPYTNFFNKPLDFDHYRSNFYSNAWYVDVEDYCRTQERCIKNEDGSHAIEMVIEFFPQRWFYLGLLISGTTLAGCLGYLGHEGVKIMRRKSKKQYEKIH